MKPFFSFGSPVNLVRCILCLLSANLVSQGEIKEWARWEVAQGPPQKGASISTYFMKQL